MGVLLVCEDKLLEGDWLTKEFTTIKGCFCETIYNLYLYSYMCIYVLLYTTHVNLNGMKVYRFMYMCMYL